jgi:NAD(P)-dependent dehydrogenase (short-subunit alcohol dehydrogenase family)
MNRRVDRVLVTGACGGLGAAVTDLLAARGITVFAADLEAAVGARKEWPHNVVPLATDVTDASSVAAALSKVAAVAQAGPARDTRDTQDALDELNGLDGLACCAGVFTGGPLAEASEEALLRAFDVNVVGAHRLVAEAFPLLARRGGTVALISSESARFAMPFNGPYTVSKYALEAYADCLRRELMLTGVRVTVIQPGSFRSGLVTGARGSVGAGAEGSPFVRQVEIVQRILVKEWDRSMAPETVARVVVRALLAERPRARYRVGNNRLRMLMRFLPTRVADAAIKLVIR